MGTIQTPAANPLTITVPTSGGDQADVSVPMFQNGITDYSTILALQSASAAAYVQWKNNDLVKEFTQAVVEYNNAMASGTEPNRQPPIAPKSFVYTPGTFSTPGTYSQTGPPIVSTVPMTTINNANLPGPNRSIPNMMLIGNREYDVGNVPTNWFQALPGDTWPNGKNTPPSAVSKDGVVGTFEKFSAPVGFGWYALIRPANPADLA